MYRLPYILVGTNCKRKLPTRTREAQADSDEHASIEDKSREKVQDLVNGELPFADGTDMERGVQQLATTNYSIIPLTSLNLPYVSLKLVPSLNPEEDSVYFGFEFVTVETSFQEPLYGWYGHSYPFPQFNRMLRHTGS